MIYCVLLLIQMFVIRFHTKSILVILCLNLVLVPGVKKNNLMRLIVLNHRPSQCLQQLKKWAINHKFCQRSKTIKKFINSIMQGGVFLNDSQRIVTAENNLFSALNKYGVTLEPELTSAGFDNTLPAFVSLFE